MAIYIRNEYDDQDYGSRFDEIFEIIKKTLNKNEDYELSVSFVDDNHIKNINKDYRNLDESTDVISFAIMDDDIIIHNLEDNFDLGDIFISIDTAKEQAKSLNQSLEKEIEFLFTHGVLHLFGYDHIEKEDEDEMFSLQREIIYEVNKETK